MKTALSAILLLLVAGYSRAQQYHPLIETGKTWDEYYSILPVLCYSWGDRVFFTDQDTVIDGLTYRKCMSQQLIQVNPGPFCPPFNVDSTRYLVAFLREDTLARRVYINNAETGGNDQLLYDFSLNAGDTLHSDYLGYGETIVIQAVDSETLNNGETRKRLVINPLLNSYYTEGIGGSYGLFKQIPVSFCECAGGYFCIKQNGTSLMGSGGNCDFPYLGQQEKAVAEPLVFPNPVEEIITVKITANLVGSSFVLINPAGVTCYSAILKQEITECTLNDLPSGIYFYRIGNNPEGIPGKLVKY